MGRSDQEQAAGTATGDPLTTAAADLWESVERQVQEIIAAAEGRAAELEGQAKEKSSEAARESKVEAQRAVQADLGRAWAILGGIDDLESRVGEAIQALRSEMEALIGHLESRAGEGKDRGAGEAR
jgi:hypothetical protein